MTKKNSEGSDKTPPSRSDTASWGCGCYRDASTALSVTLFLVIMKGMPLAFNVAEGDKFMFIRANSWLQKNNPRFPFHQCAETIVLDIADNAFTQILRSFLPLNDADAPANLELLNARSKLWTHSKRKKVPLSR